MLEFGQGRVRAAGHLRQDPFLGARSQARYGPARVGFGRDGAAQPVALLECGHKAHADAKLSRYLSLRKVWQRSGGSYSLA